MSEPIDVTRPAPAVGQRWKLGPFEREFTITGGHNGHWFYCTEGDVDANDGHVHDGACCWWDSSWFNYPSATFLGHGPQPPGAPVVPVAGELWRLDKSEPGEIAAGSMFRIKSVYGESVGVHWVDLACHGTWELLSMLERCSRVDARPPVSVTECYYCAARAADRGSGPCTIHAPNTAKPVAAATPVRLPVETWRERSYGGMRGPCSTDGCEEVGSWGGVSLCETHIAAAMVFNDGCRLKPVLFPVIPEHQPPRQQSHVSERGCLGIWAKRAR